MPRHRLPKFRIGQRVEDACRGLVRIVGVTAGPIPWPFGQVGRAKGLVLYHDLVRALQREAAIAVMHQWGVSQATVNKWRRALHVPRWTNGDLRLKVANGKANVNGIAAMHTKGAVRRATKARRTRPPAAGKPYSDRELRLIQALPPADAAKRTGRTLRRFTRCGPG